MRFYLPRRRRRRQSRGMTSVTDSAIVPGSATRLAVRIAPISSSGPASAKVYLCTRPASIALVDEIASLSGATAASSDDRGGQRRVFLRSPVQAKGE